MSGQEFILTAFPAPRPSLWNFTARDFAKARGQKDRLRERVHRIIYNGTGVPHLGAYVIRLWTTSETRRVTREGKRHARKSGVTREGNGWQTADVLNSDLSSLPFVRVNLLPESWRAEISSDEVAKEEVRTPSIER